MEFTGQQKEVRRWLERRRGILLAHNYQPGEIQDVADFLGDSLALSMTAAKTPAEVIVFCGVHFMAETAAILCPDKTVLLPREDVGCYMAATITPEAAEGPESRTPRGAGGHLRQFHRRGQGRERHLLHLRQCRARCQFFDTSRVLMVPDRNLALYTARRTSKEILYWEGCCNVHDGLSAAEVQACQAAHPQAVFIAHPECRPEVLDLAQEIRSTSGMLQYVRQSSAREFIIGTEMGILHTLRAENPDKLFYSPSPRLVCPDMKRITLADVISALKDNRHRITVPEEVRRPALLAVERMLAVPRD